MKRLPNAARLHPADMERLGQRLRELRLEKGFSQAHVAAALGCHSTNVGLLEKGRAPVSVAQLVVFAQLIGRAPGLLITELLHGLSLSRQGQSPGAGATAPDAADTTEAA